MSRQTNLRDYFKKDNNEKKDIEDNGEELGSKKTNNNPLLSKSVSNIDPSINISPVLKKQKTDLNDFIQKQSPTHKDKKKKDESKSELIREHVNEYGQKIQIRLGDITEEDVDCIVNAANGYLSHGGGVALAIARKGGYIIDKESKQWIKEKGTVETGNVAYTNGGNLLAKYVIHAVGPVYKNGKRNEHQLLRNAVRNSLEKANELGVESISLPAISSGIFGFPKKDCAEIMIDESISYFKENNEKTSLKEIRLTNFDKPTLNYFISAFDSRFNKKD